MILILHFVISTSSLLFQLLMQKMGDGLFVENSHQYASLVVTVSFGNLPMIKVCFSGFAIMDAKVQLFGKLG